MRGEQRFDLALVVVGVGRRVERSKLGSGDTGPQRLDALQGLLAEPMAAGRSPRPRAASASAIQRLCLLVPDSRRIVNRERHREDARRLWPLLETQVRMAELESRIGFRNGGRVDTCEHAVAGRDRLVEPP